MPNPSDPLIEVEGFYIESSGPVSDEFVSVQPLRVLFGRSGAGKSSILEGLAKACSGLRSLSRQRAPDGRSGLILRLGLGECGDTEEDLENMATSFEGESAKFDRRISEVGLDPIADGLHTWTAAALIGDDGMAEIVETNQTWDSYIDINYPIQGLFERAAEVAVELAGGMDRNLVIDPDDVEHLHRVTNAFLNSRNLLLASTGEMSLALDANPEVRASLGCLATSMERARSSGFFDVGDSTSSYGQLIRLVSPLYDFAERYRRSRKRWLIHPTWKMEVDTRKRSEFFEPELSRGMGRAVYLGGNIEQSVKDFERALTDAMPILHDRLIGPLLIRRHETFGLTDERLDVARSGILAPMSPGLAKVGDSPDNPWWEQIIPTGGVDVRQTVRACCVLLANRANELLPDFFQEHGEIVVLPPPIREWTTASQPHIRIYLDQDGSRIPLESVGSGIRRWLIAVVDWAYQDLLSANLEEISRFSGGNTPIHERVELVGKLSECTPTTDVQTGFLIVDEPELHLDPRAQLQVAKWLKAVSEEGKSIVLASHSPAFLTYQSHEATLTAVMSVAGMTTIQDMSTGLLEWCQEYGELVGLTHADTIMLCAGFIVVEGLHDSKVLRHFFSNQLAAARVELLHLHGTHQGEEALINTEFFAGLGKPVGILLDNIRHNRDQILRPDGRLTSEEKALKRMRMALEHQGVKVAAGGHEYPDVMCALPEDAVRRAFPSAKFSGWDQLVKKYRKVPPENFKPFARRKMKIDVGATEFIDRVLDHCSENDRPRQGLERAVKELIANLTA